MKYDVAVCLQLHSSGDRQGGQGGGEHVVVVDAVDCLERVCRVRQGSSTHYAGGNVEIIRVEQQRADGAVRRGCVDATVEPELSFAGDFDKAAVAATFATPGAHRAAEARVPVRPNDYLSAVTGAGRVCADRCRRRNVGAARVLDRRVLALIVAAHEHRATARASRHIDERTIQQRNLFPGHLDLPTVLAAIRAGRVELAAHGHDSARASFEPDDAVPETDAARLDDALVVHDSRQQGVLGLR